MRAIIRESLSWNILSLQSRSLALPLSLSLKLHPSTRLPPTMMNVTDCFLPSSRGSQSWTKGRTSLCNAPEIPGRVAIDVKIIRSCISSRAFHPTLLEASMPGCLFIAYRTRNGNLWLCCIIFVIYAGKGEIEEDDLKAATISWMHEIRVRVFSWSARIGVYFARGELFRAITDDPHIYFEAGRRREGWVKLRRVEKLGSWKKQGLITTIFVGWGKRSLFASSCYI